MNEIIPGILEQTWEGVEQKIVKVKPFAKTLHIDLLDGSFAPNKTLLDPSPFAKYQDEFFLEVHMMVADPLSYLPSFADAGFKRFIGHVERMGNQAVFVATAQRLGEVGLYLDGPTPLGEITVPLEDLDCLGIFTAKRVGFSGQSFEEEKLAKVRQVREQNILNNRGLPLSIEVDGGINQQTLTAAKEAGATRFVCTSALFTQQEIEKAFDTLTTL